MIFRLGIENDNDGRSIAWALNHPGCFAYGTNEREAESNFRQALDGYVEWIGRHGATWLRDDQGIRVVKEEGAFEVYFVDQEFERAEPGRGTMVESFFLFDWKPLDTSDVERALRLLAWSRADLLALVQNLDAEQLTRKPAGERWDINGILNHVASAEWWYQERIGYPFPEHEDDLPSDPLESLDMVRTHFAALLPQLQGLNRVVGLEGELWSPRKVLRRAAWHERDHTDHIRRLLSSEPPSPRM